MDAVKVGRRRRPAAVAGDKAYDVRRIRKWCRRRGVKAVIPERAKPHGRKPGRPITLDRKRYRLRNVVERCIGWLKACRRLTTRFEKLAVNYLGMVKLAMIQRCIRTLNGPSDTT